jgi:hypothetical protein
MNAETSDRVAGIAGRLVQMNENDIYEMARPGNIAALCDLASDIRAVAASALRQHEIEVTGSPAPTTFYDRLIAERVELAGRLHKLANFIGHEQPTVSVNFAKIDERQKLFLRAQHSFMSAYLMVLDLRIADIHLSTGQTSANDLGAYVPPFAERMQSLGEKMLGTATDEAVRHRAELGQPVCTCGESKAPCPVHEPDLQDAGPGDEQRSTARHSDKPGEIIGEGVRFTKPDPDAPLPFDE